MTTFSTTTQKGRRIARVRAKVQGTSLRPRLTVARTLSHVYAQVIDDATQRTLAAAQDSDISEADMKGKKKSEVAQLVGKLLAERAKAKGVTKVVFDRRDKRYHGRIKAVADGAREGGLNF